MGLYRDEAGRVVEIDDAFAEARGYAPLSAIEHADINEQRGLEARGTERGVIGSINAAATGIESGLTLGGSDYLLGKVLPDGERERLLAEMEAHPYLRAGGEIGGTIAAAALTGGAATPTGYLSSIASREVEAGLVAGGVKGTAKALAAMGAEGAVQSAGQYIGHASLEDKELTAEGLGGALGTGFAFGAVGGGAALGVTNGVMAGRRLFSRVMAGEKAATAAESSWSIAMQEALEADTATAQAAEVKLENFRKAKMDALRGRNEARSAAQEAKLDARGASIPKAKEPADFEASIPTDVRPAPEAPPTGAPEGPDPLIDVGEQPRGGMPTSVFKKPVAPVAAEAPAAAATDLEAQLAGTKAKLDEGASIKDIGEQAVPGSPVSPQIPPGKTPPVQPGRKPIDSISDWLSEKAAFDNGELSHIKKIEDIKGANELRMRRQETLSEIRYKATEDLLGPAIAKEEQRLADAMDEFTAARKDFEGLTGEVPDEFAAADPQATAAASPGNRQAVEILDNAHEEALLRAKHAADPQEAGQAVTEAEELEKLLEGLAAPRLHSADSPMSRSELRSPHAKKWTEELTDAASKVTRYEKASAALADEMGDAAHPVSAEKTRVLREAERDSERKIYDRTARATDDAADGIHPKVSAAKAAKKAQIDAQRKLDDANVLHQEAKNDFSTASKKVREGEAAKKAALREDAKLARVSAKTGVDVADAGGIMELLDIPGMPKPSDLPVVGPLLGAYLKYRTIRKAMGRAMGKVPATADARVAALASQTRDRVARAVDRSIGATERGAKGLEKIMPPVAGVLAHRIYDDGRPDEKKGAGLQDLAAARMRELAAYVHTPGAIEQDVRRQLAEVTDPDVIAAAEKQRRTAMEYLLSVAPKLPEPNLLNPIKYQPAPAVALSFARSVHAVNDPAGIFEGIAQAHAQLSLEAAEVVRVVYPRLFAEAGARLMERAQEGGLKVPMRTRVQLSLLYKVPLDAALDPDNLKITQSVYDRKVTQPPPGMQGAPTQPSIANPVNLSQGLTPAVDRR